MFRSPGLKTALSTLTNFCRENRQLDKEGRPWPQAAARRFKGWRKHQASSWITATHTIPVALRDRRRCAPNPLLI
jgi:hypothetical protein